ncbi:MAG: response regulator [Acidobacteriota bacterium]
MAEKILCIDDNLNVLDSYKRVLRRDFEIEVAQTPHRGLEMLNSLGPYAVILSDLQMPDMDGIRLLALVKDRSPETVRILITGYPAFETAQEAINEAGIFRFLIKPCPPTTLRKVLRAGREQHRLITSEKRLLQELESNYRQLQQLEALRDNLAQMIVHDMRTPLTTISWGLQLLKSTVEEKLDSSAQEHLACALSSAWRLNEMVNSILDVHRLEEEKMPLKLAQCDLRALAHQAADSLGWLV